MSDARAVVWLDRDGTLVDDPGYLSDPAGLVLLPGAAGAIARLRDAGAAVVLITNQSGIGRGLMTEADVRAIHEELLRRLAAEGAGLDGIYFCPHLPAEKLAEGDRACDCRKPRPGLVRRASDELGLGHLPAVVVGDKAADVGLARAVGALALLVRTGEGERSLREGVEADHVAEDLHAGVAWILRALGLDPPASDERT